MTDLISDTFMPSQWDKAAIKKLASESGRPLEVRCAEVFLTAGWKVQIGTYYRDVATEKIRELDFIAIIDFRYLSAKNLTVEALVRFRVLGSCKGFPDEQWPATFSVSSRQLLTKPEFMVYQLGGGLVELTSKIGLWAANDFLYRIKLSQSEQIVGFDVLEREELGKGDRAVLTYKSKTDKALFEGLDSAVKASTYWYEEDKMGQYTRSNETLICFNIPLLILSRPPWNVSIEGGIPGEPEIRPCGFHASSYPLIENSAPLSIMSLISSVDELPNLIPPLTRMIDDQCARICSTAQLCEVRG